jgi:ABC-type nitrate/sulfonate/bicarbonate transport system permease component
MTIGARIREWIPAIVVFFAGIAAWQLSIEIFNIQKFLLPKPAG